MVRLRPIALIAVLLLLWQFAVTRNPIHILPTPWAVVLGIGDLLQHGLLFKYVVASLFRVTWGFALAACRRHPLGLIIGWYRRAEMALNPLIQILRPISPLAWIPIAILWFGVGDLAAIFLIFLGCFFPLLLTAINAVQRHSRGLHQRRPQFRPFVSSPRLPCSLSRGHSAADHRHADHPRCRLAGRRRSGNDRRKLRPRLSDRRRA